jgi:Arc/MetJ-type ribon-helix-helix transcriptional regulator
MLDRLSDVRYASRSEAVRAAIEELHTSVMDDGRSDIEHLAKRIGDLEASVSELCEQIQQSQESASSEDSVAQSSRSTGGPASVQQAPTVNTTDSRGSADAQNEIYALLSDNGAMNVKEIAEELDEDQLRIRENIQQLVNEYNFVKRLERNGMSKYTIKQS